MVSERKELHTFVELLEKYQHLLPRHKSRQTRLVLKSIGQQIAASYSAAQKQMQTLDIRSRSIENVSQIPFTDNMRDSHFMANELLEIVSTESYGEWSCSTVIHHGKQRLRLNISVIGVSLRTKKESNAWVNDTMLRILISVFLMLELAGPGKANQLGLYYFDVSEKKFMPSRGREFTPLHINSAYSDVFTTTPNIVIFRREEWQKVLIHELIHAFGAGLEMHDVSMIEKHMHTAYELQIDYMPVESYAEAWGRILVTCLTAYDCCKRVDSKYIENAFVLLDINAMYSIWSASRVLWNWELSYEDLIDKVPQAKVYTESTSAFAYFIGTSVLLSNWSSFIAMCAANNKPVVRFDSAYKSMLIYSTFLLATAKSDDYLLLQEGLRKVTITRNDTGIKMNLFTGVCNWQMR